MMNAVGKRLACLSLLLLILMSLKSVNGQSRFNRFRTGLPSSSSSNEIRHGGRSHGSHQRAAEKNGDGDKGLFGAEKRKVHTGPNPLHNR